MLADRVRMGVVRDSFDGVLYKYGVGADLWTTTVNPSYTSHNEILQTTPFLEISAEGVIGLTATSPIATKEKYDLSKFNTIRLEYELLSDGRTEGIKEGVIDISSLSNSHPGDMYILIVVWFETGSIRMYTAPSYTQNQLIFGNPPPNFMATTSYGWHTDKNRRCRIHSYILE